MGQTKIGKTSAKAAGITKKSKASTKKEVTAEINSQKELKYLYPADCEIGKTKGDVLAKRKAFRQKVRNTMRKLEKEIRKTRNPKDKAKLQKQLNHFQKGVLV